MSMRQDRTPAAGFWARHRGGAATLGMGSILAGSLTLSFVIWVVYGRSPACRSLALSLGLALPLVISALGQLMVLVGGAWLWRAASARNS
jgi:hypothetical protein